MSEDFGTPIPSMEEPKRNNTITIVIVVVALIFLCCCIATVSVVWYLWNYGDQIFGITYQALQLLL